MPSAIPGWLPPAMVRTPPATWPESAPAPSGSSTPGLFDGLAELARPKSFEEKLAEARKYSLIPDSLSGDATSTPPQAPSSWLASAQWRGNPTTAWPDTPATKPVAPGDDAGLTPEMHRQWLDAYFRYDARKSEPQTVEEPAGESETAESLTGSNAPLFVQSGMMMTPPSGHAAPPSLDLSDPWAVAAYRTRQGVRPTFGRGDPERTEAAIRAGLVSAADPFGIPSFLIGQVSPATKDLIREQYEGHPIPSMIGSLATSTPRSVVTAFEDAAKAVPKTMTGLLGLGGATLSADEAEAAKRPPKFGKRWWGRPSTDKYWRNVPTKLDQPMAVQEAVWLDPATLPWSQRTASGNGGADRPRISERWPKGPMHLIAFAKRQDNDDLACFEVVGKGTNRVVLVHGWTPEGYTILRTFDTFWAWLKSVVDDIEELVEPREDGSENL
jgi:hypothetical protein